MNGDSYDARFALAEEQGLRIGSLQKLLGQLNADFRLDHWGYGQFDQLNDVWIQSIISDHLLAAADAVFTNLLEARVAEIDYNEMTASGAEYAPDRDLDDVREDALVVSFFRAFGSTVDCMAGVAIGVLRVPRSIVHASMRRDLFDLHPDSASDDPTKNAWRLLRRTLDELRAGPPEHWMDWALLYRDAVIHRPRQINMMLARPPKTEIILPESAIHTLVRYDTYLRRRPWLPDLEHLASDMPIADLYLGERATQTIRGLMEHLNEATERLAHELHSAWTAAGSGTLALATPSWSLRDEPDVSFAGFAPDPKATGTELRGHPQTALRLELAEQLRRRKRDA